MLRAMRRVLGLLGFALALPWVACEDRTVALSQAETLTTSSGGTAAGSAGTGGITASTSTASSATLAGPSGAQGSGGSPGFGPTGFGTFTVTSTTMSHSPFGAGGDGDVDGGHGVESGGSNGFPMGGIPSTSGGNEGGQGPDCYGNQCLCQYAEVDCDHPTPECPNLVDWVRNCGGCGPGCGPYFTCYLGIECLPVCSEEGSCDPGLHCDEGLYACVECTTDEHCAPLGKVCLTGHCVECAGRDDCTNADRPYCIAGSCRECISPDDCEGGSCNANARCVDCVDDDDCNDESRPFCVRAACTECEYDTDCEEGETCSDSSGTCSPRNQ